MTYHTSPCLISLSYGGIGEYAFTRLRMKGCGNVTSAALLCLSSCIIVTTPFCLIGVCNFSCVLLQSAMSWGVPIEHRKLHLQDQVPTQYSLELTYDVKTLAESNYWTVRRTIPFFAMVLSADSYAILEQEQFVGICGGLWRSLCDLLHSGDWICGVNLSKLDWWSLRNVS